MRLRWYHLLIIVIFIAALILTYLFMEMGKAPRASDSERDVLYQVSTIDALMQGVFDGIIPASDLEKHGDMGIGTLEGLDGEMVAVDGYYYQVRSDGTVYPVNSSAMIPFATVTFFDTDRTIHIATANNSTELATILDKSLPSKNLFYAFRAEGIFSYIKARSIPKQVKPYPNLTIAAQGQQIFEFHNVSGTIIGFYTPKYGQGVNVPGYHLHFISQDRKAGGHVLDMAVNGTDFKMDITPAFFMELPTKGDFIGVDLSKDLSNDLEQIEK